ncbi:MAG TPA: cyclase family protein [Armatimonadota bacterium]|nr:cyclase family protein [Armatimonadota bacterium]
MPDTDRKLIFLGYPLQIDTPTPPAIPPIELLPLMSLAKEDAANVTIIRAASHTGTHVDAPSHVELYGITISDFRPDELIFHHPVVVDLNLKDCQTVEPAALEPFLAEMSQADLLLFRFGYGEVRHTDPGRYSSQCPGFGVESAQFLRDHLPALRAIGMDVPSLSCIADLDRTMAAHNVLLGGQGRRFLVIEDMKLDEDLSALEEVIVAPWWIRGLDGGPCMVIGSFRPISGNDQ